ncbi:hypothetical protein DVH05_013540 [Phytophthora capsici]|nr:hypothetical protein DVH05_013540 [Phytophthora capsici]
MGKVRVGGSGRSVSSMLPSRRASVTSSQEDELPAPRVTLEPHPRSPFRRKEEQSKTVVHEAQESSSSRFKVKKATGPHLNARSPLKTIRPTSSPGKNNYIMMRNSRDDAMEISSSGRAFAMDQTETILDLQEQEELTNENVKPSAEKLSLENRPNSSALDLLLTEEQPEESLNASEDKAQQSNSDNSRRRRSSLVLPVATGTFVSSMPSLTKVRSSFTARELALFTKRLETCDSDGNVQTRYHVASHPHSTAAALHYRSNQDEARAEERRPSHKRALPSSKSQREPNNSPSNKDKVESTWKRVDTSIEHIYEDPSIDMVQQYLLHSHHTTRGQKKRKMVERERTLAAASDLREHQSEQQQRQEKLQQRKLQLQKMSEAIRLQNQKSVRSKAVHSSEVNERRTRSTRRAESAPTFPERKPPVPRLSRPDTSAKLRKRKPKSETSRPQGGVSTSILIGLTSNSSDNQQENAVKDELVDEKLASSPADHVTPKRKPSSNTPRSSKRKKQGVTTETPEVKAAVQAREERRAIAREYMQLQKQSRKVWSAKAKELSQREQEKRQQKLEILEATRLKKLRLSRKRPKEQKNFVMEQKLDERPVSVSSTIPSAPSSMMRDIDTTKPGYQPEANKIHEKELTFDESDVNIENDGGIGNVQAEGLYDQEVRQQVKIIETDDRVRKLLELREKAAALSARLNGLRNQSRGSEVTRLPSTNGDEFQARVKDAETSGVLEKDAEDGSQNGSDGDKESERADDSVGSEREANSSESSSSDSDNSKHTKQESIMEINGKKEKELFGAMETHPDIQRTELDGNDEDIDIRSIGVYNIGVVWPMEQHNDATAIRQRETLLDRSPSLSSSESLAPASPASLQKREIDLDEEESVTNEGAFELEFYRQMKNKLKSSTLNDAAAVRESEDEVDNGSSSDSDGQLVLQRRFYPVDRDYKHVRVSTGQTGDSNAGLLRLIRETDDSLSVIDRTAKRLYHQQLERSERKKDMELQERMEAEKTELLAKDLAIKTVMASISGEKSACSDSDASDVQSNAEEDELQASQYKRLEEIMDEVEKERAREIEVTNESECNTSVQDEIEQKPASSETQKVKTSGLLPASPSSAFWDQLVAETTGSETEDPYLTATRKSLSRNDQTSDNPPRLSSPKTLSRKLLAAVDYQETIFEAHMQLAMMEHSHKLTSVRAETITLAQVFKEEMENNSTAQLEKKVDSYMNDVMQQLDAIRQREEHGLSQRTGAALSTATGADTLLGAGEHEPEEASSVAETSYALEYASDDDFYEESFEKESQRRSAQHLPTPDASVVEKSRSESTSKSEIQSEQEDDFYEESFEKDSQLQTEQHLHTSDSSVVEDSRSKSLTKSEIESDIQSVVLEKDIDGDFGGSGEKITVEGDFVEESAMEAAVDSEVMNEVSSSLSVESKADESMSVNYEEDFEASSPKARAVSDHLSQDTVEDELEASEMREGSALESEVEDEAPSSPTVESKADVSMSVNYEEDFEVSSPKPQGVSNRLSQDTVEDEFEASKSSEVSAGDSTMEDEVPSSPTVASKDDASISMNYDEDFESSSPKARATSNHLSQDTVEDELKVSKSSEESGNSGDIEEEVGENDSAKTGGESDIGHVESDYYSSQFDDANALKSTKTSELQTQDQPKRDNVLTSVPNELRLSTIPSSSPVSAAYTVDLERRKQAEESLLSLRLQTLDQKYQRELNQLETTLGNGQDLETRKETLLMAFLAEKANIDSLKAASTARYYQDLHTFRSLCLDWPHTIASESNRGQPPPFSGQITSFVPAFVSPSVEIAPSKPIMTSEDDQDTSTRHEYTDDFGSDNDDAEAIDEESNDIKDDTVESRSISSGHSQMDDSVPEEEEEDFDQESDGKSVSVQEEEQENDFEQESEIKSTSAQEEEGFEEESEIKSSSVQDGDAFEQESEIKPASVQEEEDQEEGFGQENNGLVEEEEYEDEFDSMNEDASTREDVAEVAETSEIGGQEASCVESDSDYDEYFASITESTTIQKADSTVPDETEVKVEGVAEEKPSDSGEISSGSDIEVQQIAPIAEEAGNITSLNQQKYSEDDFESGQLDQCVIPPTEQSMSHRMDQSSSEDSSMTKILVAEVAVLQEVTNTMKQTEREGDKIAKKKAKVEELLGMKERLLNQQTETFRRSEEKRHVDTLAKLALGIDVEEKLRRAKADISQQLATEFDTLKQAYPMLKVASAAPTETAPTPSVMSKLFGTSPNYRVTNREEVYAEEYEAESFEEELDQRDESEVQASVDVASYEVDEVEAEDSGNDILSEVADDVAEDVVTMVVDEEEYKNEEHEVDSAPSEDYENEYENESFDEVQSVPDGDEEVSVVEEGVELPVEDTREEIETLEQSGYSEEDVYSDEAFDNASELSTNEAEKPATTIATHESIAIDPASAAEEYSSNDKELGEAIETVEMQLEETQAAKSAEPELVLNEGKGLISSISGSVSRDEIEESLTKSIEERNARLQALKQKIEDRKREILAVQKQVRVERRREKMATEEKAMLDEMEAVEQLLRADEAALNLFQQRNRLEMLHLEARERELSTGRKRQQTVREEEIDLLRGFDYIEDAQTDGKQQQHSTPASRGHSRRFDLLVGYSYIEVAEPVAVVMDTPQLSEQPAEAGKSDSGEYVCSARDARIKEVREPLTSSEHFGGEEDLDDMKSDTSEVDEEFKEDKSSFVLVEQESGTQFISELEIADESILQHDSPDVQSPVDLLADYAFVEIAEVVSCVKFGLPSADLLADYDYVEIAEGVSQDEVLQPEEATDASADDHNEFISPPGSEDGYGVFETELKEESEPGGDFMVGCSLTQAEKSSVKSEETVTDDNDASNNIESVEESVEDEEANAVDADTGAIYELGPRVEVQQSDVTHHEVVDRMSTLLYADMFQELEEDILNVICSRRFVQLQSGPQLPTMLGALPESPQSTLFNDVIGEESIDSRYTADWSVEESVQVRSPKMSLPSSENVSEEEELASIEESTAYADSFAEESFLHFKEDPDVLRDSSGERHEDVEQGGGSSVKLDKLEKPLIPPNSELAEPLTETKRESDEALQSERVADAIFGAVFDEIVSSELQLWSRQPPFVPHFHTSEWTTKCSVKTVDTASSGAKSTPGSPTRTHIQKSRARDQVLTRTIIDQLEIVDEEIRLPAFTTFNEFSGAQALYDTVEGIAHDYFRAIQQSSTRIDNTSALTLIRRSINSEISELLAVRAQSEYELDRQLQLISDESGADSGLSRDILLSQNCIVSNVNRIVAKVQSDLSRTTEELSTPATEPNLLPRTPIRRAKSTSILSSLQTQQDRELQQRITGMILNDLMRDAGLP